MGGFPPERPVYLLGESFGGILAVAVAAARPDLVNRVVLVNPATSYERSAWPVLGPLLPMVPQVGPLFRCSGAPLSTVKLQLCCVHRRLFNIVTLCLQAMYEAVPIALAPVLGNPVSLAAAGVDRSLPLQEQVRCAGANYGCGGRLRIVVAA